MVSVTGVLCVSDDQIVIRFNRCIRICGRGYCFHIRCCSRQQEYRIRMTRIRMSYIHSHCIR